MPYCCSISILLNISLTAYVVHLQRKMDRERDRFASYIKRLEGKIR